MDEIYEDIHDTLPINFENGYLGIGWGIEYLAEQKFINGDTNEILEDIDKKIMERDIRRVSDMSLILDYSVVANLIYFLNSDELFSAL